MKAISLIALVFLGGCTAIHPPRYEIRSSSWRNSKKSILSNQREDTRFEKIEQATGLGLIMAGLPAFMVGFVGQMPDWEKYCYSGLGAMTFGIAISWDGMGAFQELYEPRKLKKQMREINDEP